MGFEEIKAIEYYFHKHKSNKFIEIYYQKPSLKKDEFIKAYDELRKKDIQILITGSVSTESDFIYEKASKDNQLVIALTSSSSNLDDKKDNFYRFLPSVSILSKYLAEFFNEQKMEKIAIVSSKINPGYSLSFYKNLQKSLGNRLKYIEEKELENEYNNNFFIISSPEETLNAIIKIKKYNKNAKIISASWGFEFLMKNFKGDFLNDIYVISDYNMMYQNKIQNERVSEFSKTYNISTTFASHVVFMVMDNLMEALKNMDYNEYFKKDKYFKDTIYGDLYYNQNGDVIPKDIFVYYWKEKIKNIKNIPVEEFISEGEH